MQVELTPDLEKLVAAKVVSGRYSSVEEVVREALGLLDKRDLLDGPRNEEYRKQIEEGWLAARRGDVADGNPLFDRIDTELAALELAAADPSGRG